MPDFTATPHAMSPELRDIIQRSRWHLGAVKAVAALLPADDFELDRLIARAVADNEIPGFVYLVVAALGEGRPVDARHLRRGGPLIPDQYLFASIAGAMLGGGVGVGGGGWGRGFVGGGGRSSGTSIFLPASQGGCGARWRTPFSTRWSIR